MSGIMCAIGGGWTPLSVTLNPSDYVSGFSTTATVYSDPVTATPHGAVGSISYAWSQIDGDAITIRSPTSATTDFMGSGILQGEEKTGNFRVTVADSVSGQTAIADIFVTLHRGGGGGGGPDL